MDNRLLKILKGEVEKEKLQKKKKQFKIRKKKPLAYYSGWDKKKNEK